MASNSARRNIIQLLNAASATNSAPTAATDGYELKYINADDGTLVIDISASSGTRTFDGRVWLYYAGDNTVDDDIGVWAPAGTNSDTSLRGVINEGNQIAPGAADTTHAERIIGLRDATRIYLEVTATPGGSSPSVDAWLIRKGGQR